MNGITSKRRAFSIKDGRCELLYGRIELPGAENTDNKDAKYFNEYYGKIARCAEEWAGNYAENDIKKEYDGLNEHERKFKFRRYEYYVTYKAAESKDGVLSVDVSYSLLRSKKVLDQKVKSDVWDMECLLMMRHARKKGK